MSMVMRANSRIPPAKTFDGQRSGSLSVVDPGPFFYDDAFKSKRFVYVVCDCGERFYTREQNIIKFLSTRCMICKNKNQSLVLSKEGTGWNNWWNRYKQNAKIRQIDFELSVSELKQICTQNCRYCGDEPVLRVQTRTKNNIYANGVDRIDSKAGYTIENSAPCCSICNHIKWNLSEEDFINKVEAIHDYFVRNRWTAKS